MSNSLNAEKSIAMHINPSLWRRIVKNKAAYIYLVPAFLFIGIFKYYPFFTAVLKSMYQWNGANLDVFVSFNNFIELFKDEVFLISLRNISVYAIAQEVINLTSPLIAAMLVFNIINDRLRDFLKVSFIIPMVVPGIVVILMWRWIYAGDYGVLNQFLEAVGLENLTHAWLGESKTALIAIIFVKFPWIGGIPFLLYLAGLQKIPYDLFEMSTLEGVTKLKRIFYIDLPLILSQIKLVFVLTMIESLQAFEQFLVLTGGGPGSATMVPSLYLYEEAFTYNNFGYASAVGVIIFFIILLITYVNYKYIRETERID